MDSPVLLNFVTITIFTLMFAIGVNHNFGELLSLWRKPGLLLRSLVAVIVLVPLVVAALLVAFNLTPAVAAGLVVLAAAPGAPLTAKRSQMAGGDPAFSASLQLILALFAVIITPVILATCYTLFNLPIGRVTPFEVARQVAQVTFLPVIIGLLLQQFAPATAERLVKPVQIIAKILFLLLFLVLIVLLALKPELRAMLNLGKPSTMAIIAMVGVSLAIGHFLGGPIRARRSSLAIACIARNVGLAMYIAGLSDYGEKFIPTLLAYMILGAVLGIPYSVWSKRQMKQQKPA